MIINFRQGIVLAKGPWLFKTGSTVGISSGVLFTLSEEDTNYLWTEPGTASAWTVTDQKTWLYLEIDKDNANRTFGSTTINPFIYTAPSNPTIGQMYYDVNEYRFKEWSGQYWIDVLRVFVGYVDSGNITKQSIGTQVNVYESADADYIVIGTNGLPVKRYDDTSFTFYNKTTIRNFKREQTDTLMYARVCNVNGVATGNISSYKCVGWSDYNKLSYADPKTIPAIGFALINAESGDILSFHYDGFIQSDSWQFNDLPNTSIYLADGGEISTGIDATSSIQRLGYIVSPNTLYIDIGETYHANK